MTTPFFPDLLDYALDHRCPMCYAKPGDQCDAPMKIASARALAESIKKAGGTPRLRPPMHAARQDRGIAHYRRDVGRAPWPEDRVAGTNYGTLTHTRSAS
jgi:hypothetical protein